MMSQWKMKRLGDVCTLQRGFDLPTHSRKAGVFPLVSSNGVTDRIDQFKVKAPGVVTGRSGSIGNIHFITEDFWPLNTSLYVKEFHGNYPRFVFHLLNLFDLSRFASGAGVPTLNRNHVHDEKIFITTDYSEQKRIVEILDETFAAINKAKANVEKNLQNAKELFESYLQNVFANKGEVWEEKRLGEVAEVEYGYTDNSTTQGDYRYIRITDIDKNGELILEEKKYIKHSKEAENFILKQNDLLMARTGATFAKVLLYKDYEPSVFASYLIRIKFKEKIENELYWHFTKTKYYWEQANSLSSGAAQPHFNGAALKQVIFSYPKSSKEQKLLIEKFKVLSIETKKLEIIYQQKLNDLEELKKSILQKAFSGELTAKNFAI